jgi:proteasome lid subunit RPN8/RPN11
MNNFHNTPKKSNAQRSYDQSPLLTFTPTAWAKLVYVRDLGDSEVGGFGISADDDPLLIEDVQLVEQSCTPASVIFDDTSVADFFDRQVDSGRKPQQFARIWVHTHPGSSARPSMTDEETFERVFGSTDWAVMFILAQEGQTYARLRFNVGPGAAIEIPVDIDYGRPFAGTDHAAWSDDYEANVHVAPSTLLAERGWWPELQSHEQALIAPEEVPQDWLDDWGEYAEQHESSYEGGAFDVPDSRQI